MNKRVSIAVAVASLCVAGFAGGQEMILNMVAQKVVSRYQTASCEQLWQRRASPSRRRRSGPSISCATTRRRAPSSSTRSPDGVNKMFECGMVP